MRTAFLFPGQGAQFPGMGRNLYESDSKAKELFEQANEILGFRISDIMFDGTPEQLKETKVTQPAVFLHSVITFLTHSDAKPEAVAGHSLGEFSALVASGALNFEDGLKLVSERATAMQKACEMNPSTMAAIIGLPDEKIEQVCSAIKDEIVVPANYNCPGQLVISGSMAGIETACDLLKAEGAKRALVLQVGGGFHSPLMAPAGEQLKAAIDHTRFNTPNCPVYQNVDALPHTSPEEIKENITRQLTAPVRWTYIMQNMLKDGFDHFVECGPGKVLQGLAKKVSKEVTTEGMG